VGEKKREFGKKRGEAREGEGKRNACYKDPY